MSGSNDHGPLVVGGEPRIDFLPPETKKGKEYRRQRRSLVALVIAVAAVCAVAIVFSYTFAVASLAALQFEDARSQVLRDAQEEYVDLRAMQGSKAALDDARLVAMETEVLWSDYFLKMAEGLPEGAFVRDLRIDGQSALESAPVVDVALQNPRAARFSLTIEVTDLHVADAVTAYLDKSPSLADVSSQTVTRTDVGTYLMEITLDISSEAFERRFFPPAEGEPAPDDSSTEEPTEEGTPTATPTPEATATEDPTTEDEG